MTLAKERSDEAADGQIGRSRRWLLPVAAIGSAVVVAGMAGVVVPDLIDDWHFVSVLHEDFAGDAALGSFPDRSGYTKAWSVYPDGWGDTSGAGTYAPSRTLSVSDGRLNIDVHADGGQYLGAAVVANATYGQTYGRFSVRWRADPVTGYGLAFLLWPDSERWPDDGEIDFPEGSLDGDITATAHHADPSGGKDQFGSGTTMENWHTSVVEWTPSQITFSLDGRFVGRSTTKVPQNPMHWVMQVGTDGTGVPPQDARGAVQVDWVQIDAYRG
jgi:beta-glucanase (GH16 family)